MGKEADPVANTKRKPSGGRSRQADTGAFAKFKAELEAGTAGRAYVFYGEEAYLRDYYLGKLRDLLVSETTAAFNYHRMEGKNLTVQRLTEAVEAMPMMADRTLVVVSDYDLFRLGEGDRTRITALLSDLPEWCCLVFHYDTVSYQPNRTMKKLCKALDENVEAVEFRPLGESDLIRWVGRRFRELDREIDTGTAQYLIFTCGDLIAGLIPETAKIAAYAQGKAVTRQDIDDVAIPVLSAEVYRLTDAAARGDGNAAAAVLGSLLKMQYEPVYLLASVGSHMRRLYAARTAVEQGKNQAWLMDLFGIREYPAKLLMRAARNVETPWCREAVCWCETLDRRLKSESGIDGEGELKLLILRLCTGRSAGRNPSYGGRA